MASEGRAAQDPVAVIRRLQENLYQFGFFQALRHMECAYGIRIGTSLHPADDPIRLAQEPSLAFAPSTLASFKPGVNRSPHRLAVYFFGLFGPNGPLPHHLTDYARDRKYNYKDPAFVRFADIFHHRIMSIFYRAWAGVQPTVSFDRPDTDRFSLYVGSLFGLGMPSLRNRDAFPDFAKLHFAGHLASQNRHAEGLEAMIGDYFRVPVRIDEFVGRWIEFPKSALLRLGGPAETAALGKTAVLGARVWDCQHKFRIILGPLDLVDFERFLPGSDSLDRLAALVRNYTGDELEWDMKLMIKPEEMQPFQLGGKGRLGMTSWFKDRSGSRKADDLLLDPLALKNIVY